MRTLLVLASAAVLAVPGIAAADSAYHTERLPLHGLAGAPGGGMVVNAHANGPKIYAHEIYTLRHALPGTYQVALHLYPAQAACTGDSLADVPTAELATNAAGNGRADMTFTPEMAGDLRGSTLSLRWTVTSDAATYATDCTVVTLD